MIVKGCVIFERTLLSRKKSYNLAWSCSISNIFYCALFTMFKIGCFLLGHWSSALRLSQIKHCQDTLHCELQRLEASTEKNPIKNRKRLLGRRKLNNVRVQCLRFCMWLGFSIWIPKSVSINAALSRIYNLSTVICKHFKVSVEKHKQKAALRYFSWKSAVWYCLWMVLQVIKSAALIFYYLRKFCNQPIYLFQA